MIAAVPRDNDHAVDAGFGDVAIALAVDAADKIDCAASENIAGELYDLKAPREKLRRRFNGRLEFRDVLGEIPLDIDAAARLQQRGVRQKETTELS